MPFVEIFVSERRSSDERRKLGEAVHRALVATVDVPPDDRFQVLSAHAASDLIYDPGYLGIARSPELVAIRITLRRGRAPAKKRALYRAIVDEAKRAIGLREQDVLVVLSENEALDWSFGNGVAQYAPEA
jgi:phenylpyruvate tautomerase PptA (4-oxalocrotonate tautomerase family)